MNKVAIITGSTSGIGEATAILFADNGYSVVVTGRNQRRGASVCKRITDRGGAALFVRADLTKRSEAAKLVSAAAKLGDVHVLVNNAGGNNGQSLEQEVATNFFSCVYCTEAVREHLTPGGNIVNVASICGCSTVCNGITYYAAAKAAMLNYTKNMAKNLAPKIRVNAILPGYTKTPDWGELSEADELKFSQEVPIARFIAPEEIADAIWFVTQNAAITGTELVIDGGRTLV